MDRLKGWRQILAIPRVHMDLTYFTITLFQGFNPCRSVLINRVKICRYAHEKKIKIIPVKLGDVYPPEPPGRAGRQQNASILKEPRRQLPCPTMMEEDSPEKGRFVIDGSTDKQD